MNRVCKFLCAVYTFLFAWIELILITTFVILMVVHWENISVVKRCCSLLVTILNVIGLLIISYGFRVKNK